MRGSVLVLDPGDPTVRWPRLQPADAQQNRGVWLTIEEGGEELAVLVALALDASRAAWGSASLLTGYLYEALAFAQDAAVVRCGVAATPPAGECPVAVIEVVRNTVALHELALTRDGRQYLLPRGPVRGFDAFIRTVHQKVDAMADASDREVSR